MDYKKKKGKKEMTDKEREYHKEYMKKRRAEKPHLNTEAVARWRENHRAEYNEYMRDYRRKKKAEAKAQK